MGGGHCSRHVVNMGGIELGSSDKHTQNHTYPRIARNPELRGIRGGSLCQLNPAYKKTLFSSYEMGGGMHCAVQTMFRPCSDSIWVQTQSSAAHLLLHLLTPMSFLKDSTDVRNMTHYRLILGRRGLSSSNGGRSTDTSATSDSLIRPAFCERSSLALLSPLQKDTTF